MAETYLEITRQIEELKQKAEAVREQEIDGVIERIRSAIQAYGLTTAQLFGPSTAGGAAGRPASKKGGAVGKRSPSVRFRDTEGHSWSGRGPRPGWLKAAMAAGKTMDDFKVAGASGTEPGAASAPVPSKRRSRGAAGKAPMAPRFKDDAGHSWSGRGPRPGWFKAALEAGKKPEELAA